MSALTAASCHLKLSLYTPPSFSPCVVPCNIDTAGRTLHQPLTRTAIRTQTLPVETLSEIFRYVTGTSDLCAVTRANRTFQREAEALLYRSAEILYHHNTLYQFCKAILPVHPVHDLGNRNLRITRLRSLHVKLTPKPIGSLYRLFARVLREAKWLKKLMICAGAEAGWILRDCTFQLSRFQCDIPCCQQLWSFLETQKELKDIWTKVPGTTPCGFSHTAAPGLEIVKLSMACARQIVPNRPVSHVHIIDSVENEGLDEALEAIATSKAAMRSLDITTSRLSPDVIVRVAAKLPELVRLAITDDSDFDPEGPGPAEDWIDGFQLFKVLQSLTVYFTLTSPDTRLVETVIPAMFERLEKTIIKHWACACPTLLSVCVGIYGEDGEQIEGCTFHWTRKLTSNPLSASSAASSAEEEEL